MKFTKMQSGGNDYIYINSIEENIDFEENMLTNLIVKISDRHYGVGSDGVVFIMKSTIADFKMRMFNNDGSEGAMCGNACCCIGKYVYEKGLWEKDNFTLETNSGIKQIKLHINKEDTSKTEKVTVNMGEPIFEASKIPIIHTSNEKYIIDKEVIVNSEKILISSVSMGNPHCVIFIDEPIEDVEFKKKGEALEKHSIFPNHTNVEFARVINKENIIMRVWERGSGETLSCGTGTCAVLVTAVLKDYCEKDTDVKFKVTSGNLVVNWNSQDNQIYYTGTEKISFEGVWNN